MNQVPTKIIIHCSATKNFMHVPAKTIKKWHMDKGWSDIGYHIVIQPDGEVELGRPLNVIGAHTRGFNRDSIGICMVGNDRFSKAAFRALREYIYGLQMTYDIPYHKVFCHYEFTKHKTCPNMRAADLVAWLIYDNDDSILEYIGKSPYT